MSVIDRVQLVSFANEPIKLSYIKVYSIEICTALANMAEHRDGPIVE